MMKKFMLFFVVIALGASFLSGCKSSTDVSGSVNPTDLMKVLNKKAEAVAKTPGWLHVTEKIVYDIDKENNGVLPNGAAIPLEQINDTWYHINDSGQAYQYVNQMTTKDGDLVQVSVFNDTMIVNLTTSFVMPMNPYYLGALDYRFSNEMQDFIDRTGKTPKVEVTEVDGVQAAVFTIEEKLDTPATTDNYTEPVYGVRTVAYFDMTTGLLFRLVRYRIFEDGSERTFFQTDITVEPNAQPSQDILDYMKGIN